MPEELLHMPSSMTRPAAHGSEYGSTLDVWSDLSAKPTPPKLGAALCKWLSTRRWFGSKSRTIEAIQINDSIALPDGADARRLVLAQVQLQHAEPQQYVLLLGFTPDSSLCSSVDEQDVIALCTNGMPGCLYGADRDVGLAKGLLEMMASELRLLGNAGELVGLRTSAFAGGMEDYAQLKVTPLSVEQSNTSFCLGEQLILKLFRRVVSGPNPDLEVGTFLTEVGFPYAARVLGGIEYQPSVGQSASIAILQSYVPNQGDAWSHALAQAGQFLEAISDQVAAGVAPATRAHPLDLVEQGLLKQALSPAQGFLDQMALLGQRTAQLHLALCSRPEAEAFVPEPLSADGYQAMVEKITRLLKDELALLEVRRADLSEPAALLANRLLARADVLLARVKQLGERPVKTALIRIHGDYHLGQVLWTGNDFVIIDFEGEPSQSMADRRAKRPALRDVAGMLRSLQYAGSQAVVERKSRQPMHAPQAELFEAWGRSWAEWSAAAFLGAWMHIAHGASFGFSNSRDLRDLLDLLLLEKAIYELGYELNHRPDWVSLPLTGLMQMIEP